VLVKRAAELHQAPGSMTDLLALDKLAGVEARGPGLRVPTTGRRLPGLGRVDVVAAGNVPGGGLALGLPDVGEVVARPACGSPKSGWSFISFRKWRARIWR